MNTSTHYRQTSRFTAPEPLETRIAPALFFLSAVAADFVVRDSTGATVAGDLPAKTFTGADLVLPLVAGDRLIYDKDGNHAFSIAAGDRELVSMSSRRSLIFLEDVNTDAQFDLADEITGIAVTGGASGALFGDSNGGLIVALLSNGTLDTSTPGTLAAQSGSLTNWKVAGDVDGDVLAGGAITNLSIGGTLFGTPGGPGVDVRVATGTATDGRSVSFDGGTTVLTTDFVQPAGAGGPGITNVQLCFGAREVIAGDTALDGLIIVRNGGLGLLPIAPLKLVTVP